MFFNKLVSEHIWLTRGGFIILAKQIKGIRESVAIANQFYLIAGLILIIVGSIVMLVVSKKITKSIADISEAKKALLTLILKKE